VPVAFREIIMSMGQQFLVIIEKDEDGYFVASVPHLKGCHTQARSLDEVNERIKEVILLCLEVYGEETEDLSVVFQS
jgi:predicted RNase H-like HicB family nuclease